MSMATMPSLPTSMCTLRCKSTTPYVMMSYGTSAESSLTSGGIGIEKMTPQISVATIPLWSS